MFILYSIPSSLGFWSVHHTSIYENFELNVYKNIFVLGKVCSNWSNDLLGINVYNTFEPCW